MKTKDNIKMKTKEVPLENAVGSNQATNKTSPSTRKEKWRWKQCIFNSLLIAPCGKKQNKEEKKEPL